MTNVMSLSCYGDPGITIQKNIYIPGKKVSTFWYPEIVTNAESFLSLLGLKILIKNKKKQEKEVLSGYNVHIRMKFRTNSFSQ